MYEQQVFYNGSMEHNNLDLWDKFKVTFSLIFTEKKAMVKFNFSIGFSTFLLRRLMALTGF